MNTRVRQQWANHRENDEVKVRVHYSVSTGDGFVHIQRVDVLCGNQWSCYYDHETRRIGEVINAGMRYRFLLEDSLEPIVEAISTYELDDEDGETQLEVDRLASKEDGPDALPRTHRE